MISSLNAIGMQTRLSARARGSSNRAEFMTVTVYVTSTVILFMITLKLSNSCNYNDIDYTLGLRGLGLRA
jgi:hypothetical protein